MSEKILQINPKSIAEYLDIVDKRFQRWHDEEWFSLTYEEFLKISSASFLAYLGYILEATNNEGTVDLEGLSAELQMMLGDYYRTEKFEKAISFVEENQWEYL